MSASASGRMGGTTSTSTIGSEDRHIPWPWPKGERTRRNLGYGKDAIIGGMAQGSRAGCNPPERALIQVAHTERAVR